MRKLGMAAEDASPLPHAAPARSQPGARVAGCAADMPDLPLTPARHVSLYQPVEQTGAEAPV